MKYTLLPKSLRGKWATLLLLAFLVLGIAANRISTLIGNTIEYPNPINSPLLGSVIYLTFLSAIIGALIGYISIKKDMERSLLVYFVTVMGTMFFAIILIFLVANLFGPPN